GAKQAADCSQPQVGIETQDALGDGAEACGRPATQAPGDQQGDPGEAQRQQDSGGQARQGGVVQGSAGQAAEQQGGKQDEVIDPLGAGPESFVGEAAQVHEVAGDDKSEQGPEGKQKRGH